ncbi:MAG: nickel-dependent hydrogenase large subunit, partial [Planctomycetota bacterium]
VPANAQYIRNLILIAHGLHDHIVHFYHLSALDWVDVTTVPEADPQATLELAETLSPWPGNSLNEFRQVQQRVKDLLASGQLGIFAHGYWGHPAMKLPPEANLLAVTHYFQALEFQRKATQAVAILGAKSPHIQNVAVGGVMNAIDLDGTAALNMDKLYMIKSILDDVVPFVKQVYFPDACAIAALYDDWFGHGRGVVNYLSVPDLPTDGKATAFDLPGGVILDGDLEAVRPFRNWKDPIFRKGVTEDVARAYYTGAGPIHPFEETTDPDFTEFDADRQYTWVKAPRFEGHPTQVGPLATVLVGYGQGDALTRRWTDQALQTVSSIAGREITIDDLHSTMGRYLARAIRCAILSDLAVEHWSLFADNVLGGDVESFNPPTFPEGEVEGVGMHEAPRGALSHWVRVRDGKIANYQAVVPTTWNASPRDHVGVPGPYESCLVDNPVADPERPLEVLRTVHSFDPCMACACHTFDPRGREISRVRVL